jgi:hypothetical protein
MQVKLKSAPKAKSIVKPLGKLTKVKLSKHLTDHFKAQGMHPAVLKHLRASGFLGDLWDGVKSAVSKVVSVVKPLVKPTIGAISGYQKGGPMGALMGALGSGKPTRKSPAKKPSSAKLAHNNKMKKRGKMIAELMKKKGISLGEASKLLSAK